MAVSSTIFGPPAGAGGSLGQGLTLNSSGLIDNNLTTGIAGGQTIKGGTAASENLILTSTANATKGLIEFGSSTGLVYDETNIALGIGKTPSVGTKLDITSSGAVLARAVTTGTNVSSSFYVASPNTQIELDAYASGSAGTIFGVNKTSLATLTVPTGGALAIGTVPAADVIFGANNTEAFRIDNASAQFKVAAAGLTANGTGTVTFGNLAPGTTAVTIQKWWTVKDSAGGTFRIPLLG